MAGWVVKWEEKKYDSGGMYGVHGHDTFFAVAPAADQNDGLPQSELLVKLMLHEYLLQHVCTCTRSCRFRLDILIKRLQQHPFHLSPMNNH